MKSDKFVKENKFSDFTININVAEFILLYVDFPLWQQKHFLQKIIEKVIKKRKMSVGKNRIFQRDKNMYQSQLYVAKG